MSTVRRSCAVCVCVCVSGGGVGWVDGVCVHVFALRGRAATSTATRLHTHPPRNHPPTRPPHPRSPEQPPARVRSSTPAGSWPCVRACVGAWVGGWVGVFASVWQEGEGHAGAGTPPSHPPTTNHQQPDPPPHLRLRGWKAGATPLRTARQWGEREEALNRPGRRRAEMRGSTAEYCAMALSASIGEREGQRGGGEVEGGGRGDETHPHPARLPVPRRSSAATSSASTHTTARSHSRHSV